MCWQPGVGSCTACLSRSTLYFSELRKHSTEHLETKKLQLQDAIADFSEHLRKVAKGRYDLDVGALGGGSQRPYAKAQGFAR